MMGTRRFFLSQLALGLPWFNRPWIDAFAHMSPTAPSWAGREGATADLVIIGGGLGGCAAAMAALRNGLRVVMTEETDWIGGQLTAQAVPPDENAWIETIGGTQSYREFRTALRDHYRQHYPLTPRAKANPRLNPGNCWVSRLGCEPTVILQLLQQQLAPYIQTGQLVVLLEHVPTRALVRRDRVESIEVQHRTTGDRRTLTAPWFVDATEHGDLLPMTGTEHVVGAESQQDTGEPHAAAEAQPDNVQAFTVCFAMDYLAGTDQMIDRPRDYAHWREVMVRSAGRPPQRLLSFADPDSQRIGFDPVARTGYWSYRRILDKTLFTSDTIGSDVTLVNWAHNDYSFGALTDGTSEDRQRHIAQAKQLSLSLLYWLQTEMPRADGGTGWPGLRLRPDIVGTADGLAKYPYVRESRRIRAEFTVVEQHVLADLRREATGLPREQLTAALFADSVGIGHYALDLHLTTRGDRTQFGETLPFQIPLGALLPQRVENLLPACKNLGVTHLTNGCFRLHPIEWNIGESVGELVAFCRARKTRPHAVRATAGLLADFQAQLVGRGIPLAWPHPLPKGS